MNHPSVCCWRWAWLCVLTVSVLAGCKSPQADFAQDYQDAQAKLRRMAEEPDPQVRTKALEALAATEGREAGKLVMRGLQDEHVPVRFAAAMAVGDMRYEPAKPLLLAIAKDSTTPPKLLCAVIYALHRVGDTSYTKELGRLLFYPEDKWVRATAAMVMGRLGEPAAEDPLENLRRDDRDPVVQLQVVEALATLGDARCIALLRAFTKSQFIEDQIIAVQGLSRVRGAGAVSFLQRLMRNRREDPAVRIAAAGSLAQLNDASGYDLALQAAVQPERVLRTARRGKAAIRPGEISNLQTLAVLALGHMNNTDAVAELRPLLSSADGSVRVAACQSILLLLAEYRPARHRPAAPVAPAELPETQPATEPATQPATESATQPASEPATQPATQPTTEPATEPATQPTTEPATEPVAVPVIDF